jgi:hypothetical protein
MDKKTIMVMILGVVLFIGLIMWRKEKQDDLKMNGVIVQAQIIRILAGGKTGGGFQCLFKYNDKKIMRSSPCSFQGGKLDFLGKTFPAMYAPNTNTLEILIAPEDFKKFNISFPDSLHWVLDYVH